MPDFERYDIIAPREHLEEWTTWGLVVEEVRPNGSIVAYRLGGGFNRVFSLEKIGFYDFVKVPDRLLENPTWYTGKFYAEWIDKTYRGWTTGAKWNGWAVPYFEFDEALRYANDSGNTRYDQEKDAFVTIIEGQEDDPEIDAGTIISVPDRGDVVVYPIGAGSWTWAEAREGSSGFEEDDQSVKDWRPPY
jgi:hypothetical protein